MSTPSLQHPTGNNLEMDRPRRGNQHLPLSPRSELCHWIQYYWHLGFTDPKIAEHVMDHFDREMYGCSAKSVQRLRKALGLKGTIQQAASFEMLETIYEIIWGHFPHMGARQMVTTIRQDYSIKVSEDLVNRFLRETEPDAVAARKSGRFKRKIFWSAGVMEYWSIDQHDKWGRFGLWLHLGIDPFTGRFAWLKTWWCNRNPRLLINYYLDAGRQVGGIPLMTMSDRGRDMHGRGWKNVFLIEEVIRGDEQGPFRKYLNNVSPVPLPISCGDDDERAKFLSFSQHVQYWKTKKQAFVSDYQGGNSLLTDPQISSSPFLGPIFADGNVASIHRNFKQEHQCNYFCAWFSVPTDYNLRAYDLDL